jgi:hypothetical protein
MSVTIIVKDEKPKGETRANLDERLRKEGFGTMFKTDEQRDKCQYLERKIKKICNVDAGFASGLDINKVK